MESVLGETALFAMGSQDGLDPIASVELLELQLFELGLFRIGEPTSGDEAFDFSFASSFSFVHFGSQFGSTSIDTAIRPPAGATASVPTSRG